jgi:hypothetical protein
MSEIVLKSTRHACKARSLIDGRTAHNLSVVFFTLLLIQLNKLYKILDRTYVPFGDNEVDDILDSSCRCMAPLLETLHLLLYVYLIL